MDSERHKRARALSQSWSQLARWKEVVRPYSSEQVVRLQGSITVEHTLARRGAEKLWELMQMVPFVRTLSAMTGNQAIQEVQAGLDAIYVSGWQTAGDANTAGEVYPDQSLYPADSVPQLVRRINKALMRADLVQAMEVAMDGAKQTVAPGVEDWFVPVVADGEAGFGGNLNAFELTRALIEAGAAGVHFEDQLSSAKKCGHMGGKVLVPTQEFVQKLVAARLAADVEEVPTIIIGRTDAQAAHLITSDVDATDHRFLQGARTSEGFYSVRCGLEFAIERALVFAPYADLIWCETSTPDLGEAREFAQAIHQRYPGKMLAYNCSPSFNWSQYLDEASIASFQERLGEMGYKFQFVTLSGWHALNASMFELARAYRDEGMAAYARLQNREFQLEKAEGYGAIRHQRFVGAGYFDEVQMTITAGTSQTTALRGSTEQSQFEGRHDQAS